MQAQTIFTARQQAAIAAMCKDLTRRTQRTVVAEYGQTEDGQIHDVALCVESLPAGSWGIPGPLVSLLAGPGVPGAGFATLDAEGIPALDGVEFAQALSAAKFEGMRGYRRMSEGALRAA